MKMVIHGTARYSRIFQHTNDIELNRSNFIQFGRGERNDAVDSFKAIASLSFRLTHGIRAYAFGGGSY